MAEGLRAFFQRYAAAYDLFDVPEVASFFHIPSLTVRFGKVIHLADEEALHAYLSGLLAAYREQGYRHGIVAGLEERPLGANSVLAVVDWVVQRADGTMLAAFETTYNLIRAGDGWQIVLSTRHDV